MKSLLAVEWLKIKKYRTFWVLAIFFLALLPLWNIFIYNGFISAGGGKGGGINVLSQSYSFPGIWGNLGFWGSIFVLFPSILVIILTANEYTFRTNRQNVIDGYSRLQFFHAKCVLILVLALAATLYLFLTGAVMGAVVSNGIDGIFSEISKVGYFFLLALNYMGFAFFTTVVIRKSGLAIGLFLLYSLIIENMLKGLLNWLLPIKLGNLFPLQASDELLPFSFMRMAESMMGVQQSIPMYVYVLVTCGWCALYYFIARRILLRRDW